MVKPKFVLVITGSILGIFAAELILRLLGLPHFYKYHSTPPQFSFYKLKTGQLFWLNTPSADIRFIYDGDPRGYFDKDNGIIHTTNSQGFRGKEFNIEKPQGIFRIAFLGDSCTFGEGVRLEDTYCEQTIKLLSKENSVLGVKFEGLNLGVSGYNTSDMLFLLKNFVFETAPDLVVLKHDISDAEPRLFGIDNATGGIKRYPPWHENNQGVMENAPAAASVYEKFRLAGLFWQARRNWQQNHKILKYYNSLFSPGNEGWERSRRALKETVSLCQEKNIPCYIVFFPILYRLNNQYPFKQLEQIIHRELENSGAEIIDLFPYLQGKDAQKLWVHPADHHPNEKVHLIAAEAIAKKLLSDPKIKKV